MPIVVLEPSCFAVFHDEATNLVPESAEARALSRHATLFEPFIRPHLERGDLPAPGGRALVHLHCHEKALVGADPATAALAAAKLDARIVDAGCCGMAGSFGFDKEHYQVSIDVSERVLLLAVREAPDDMLIIANGFSCREQIRQTTRRRAQHFAEIVWAALRNRT